MLIVGTLGAIQQHLGQARFGITGGAPLVDLLLGVDLGETLRVLQVEHRQGDQGVALAIGEGLAQQGFGFQALGFAGIGLGRKQAAKASLGPWRGVDGRAVGRFGGLDLRRVARADLDIGQADLGIAVAKVRQLTVITLGQGRVATLECLVGQALVGQAGATGQTHGDGQAADFKSIAGKPAPTGICGAQEISVGAGLPDRRTAAIECKAFANCAQFHRHIPLKAHEQRLYQSTNPTKAHGHC
ncbi:hypothetical protein D9M71_299880 [compost metagenome]